MKSLYFSIAICCLTVSCKDEKNDNPTGLTLEEKYAGCCETTPQTLESQNGAIFIPNAFTPNADGNNDLFLPMANQGVTIIAEFEVLDRDNKSLINFKNFIPNDPALSWNGLGADGKPYEGKFLYKISYFSKTGVKQNFQGTACAIVCHKDTLLPILTPGNCGFPSQIGSNGLYDPTIAPGEIPCY